MSTCNDAQAHACQFACCLCASAHMCVCACELVHACLCWHVAALLRTACFWSCVAPVQDGCLRRAGPRNSAFKSFPIPGRTMTTLCASCCSTAHTLGAGRHPGGGRTACLCKPARCMCRSAMARHQYITCAVRLWQGISTKHVPWSSTQGPARHSHRGEGTGCESVQALAVASTQQTCAGRAQGHYAGAALEQQQPGGQQAAAVNSTTPPSGHALLLLI